uniref:CSON009146 protein n=1 Tax=Culicoides sonorensis TaxID=179676 RepID=A0A336JYZ5_CULSO
MLITLVILTISTIIFVVYLYLKHIFTHWKRHEFPFIEPVIPYGNLQTHAKKQRSMGNAVWDLYNSTSEPFIGIYTYTNPAVLIRDIELVKKVLVTDFDYFHDRNVYNNKEKEPLLTQLFSMKGEEWKNLRRKFNPLFSSGKLKAMFPTIMNEVDKLDEYVLETVKSGTIFENKDQTYRYVLNLIGSIVFGIDIDVLKDPNHPFEKMHKKILSADKFSDFKNTLQFLCPKLLDILPVSVLTSDVKTFFLDVVQTTIDSRAKQNFRRNDFMQLMIDNHEMFTLNEITANCIIFYLAGADTSPFTVATCLYELALNPVLQRKAQNEIDTFLAKNGGTITYDLIHEMTYLEACVKETLRKFPGLPVLLRECTKDYKIPNSKLTIKKGTSVFVSAIGLQYDPKYFPDPFKFDPDRFLEDSNLQNKDAYLPFGDGPRKCIAVRMGFLFVKVALVKLLSKYDWETVDNKPIEFDTYSVGVSAKGGLPLKAKLRMIEN